LDAEAEADTEIETAAETDSGAGESAWEPGAPAEDTGEPGPGRYSESKGAPLVRPTRKRGASPDMEPGGPSASPSRRRALQAAL
jgi:hypothetical protein